MSLLSQTAEAIDALDKLGAADRLDDLGINSMRLKWLFSDTKPLIKTDIAELSTLFGNIIPNDITRLGSEGARLQTIITKLQKFI